MQLLRAKHQLISTSTIDWPRGHPSILDEQYLQDCGAFSPSSGITANLLQYATACGDTAGLDAIFE